MVGTASPECVAICVMPRTPPCEAMVSSVRIARSSDWMPLGERAGAAPRSRSDTSGSTGTAPRSSPDRTLARAGRRWTLVPVDR